jgi:hypothetical protein
MSYLRRGDRGKIWDVEPVATPWSGRFKGRARHATSWPGMPKCPRLLFRRIWPSLARNSKGTYGTTGDARPGVGPRDARVIERGCARPNGTAEGRAAGSVQQVALYRSSWKDVPVNELLNDCVSLPCRRPRSRVLLCRLFERCGGPVETGGDGSNPLRIRGTGWSEHCCTSHAPQQLRAWVLVVSLRPTDCLTLPASSLRVEARSYRNSSPRAAAAAAAAVASFYPPMLSSVPRSVQLRIATQSVRS